MRHFREERVWLIRIEAGAAWSKIAQVDFFDSLGLLFPREDCPPRLIVVTYTAREGRVVASTSLSVRREIFISELTHLLPEIF